MSYVAGEAIAAAADVNREEGGREALEAAEAVAAIMAATYDWSTSKQKMTLGVRPDKKLPPGLQAGLRKVAEAYIPDLAYSLANPGTNENQTDPARHKVVVKDGRLPRSCKQ